MNIEKQLNNLRHLIARSRVDADLVISEVRRIIREVRKDERKRYKKGEYV